MPPRAIVVCPVLPEPPVTGGQKRTLRLLEAIERAGGTPHVVTADASGPSAAAALRARGWDVDIVAEPHHGARQRVRQHLARRPSPYLGNVARRVGELAGEGAALLQLEHTLSAYYVPLAGDVPVLLSLHNVDSKLYERNARAHRPGSWSWLREWNLALELRAVERRALPRVDRVACVSEDDGRLAERDGGRTLLAPNGIDDEFFTVGEPEGGEEVVFFGHLGYDPNRRGVLRFVAEGWPEVLRRRPAARLAIAGAGLDERLAARLAAAGGVRVLGLVEDMPAALAAARVVVAPVWEGGGTRLKVLEALAAARPVAGTAVAVEGVGFRDGVDGLVADAPGALGAAVAELLADPERAREMGAAGRAAAAPSRWPLALAELERAYRGWFADTPPG